MLVAAVGAAVERARFAGVAQSATGVVVDAPFGPAHSQIEFQPTPDAPAVRFSQGGWAFLERGERVTVLFLAEAPGGTACVDAVGALYFVPALLGALGSGLLLLAGRRR